MVENYLLSYLFYGHNGLPYNFASVWSHFRSVIKCGMSGREVTKVVNRCNQAKEDRCLGIHNRLNEDVV